MTDRHSDRFVSCQELGSFFLTRNLEALKNRWPRLADMVQQTDSSNVLLIPDGGPNYRCRIGDTWIHGPEPIAKELERLRKPVERALQTPNTDLLYLHGTGLGYMAAEIVHRTKPRGDPHEIPIGIVFLEHRAEMFKAMLQLSDWTPVLQSPRMFFCMGAEIGKTCREIHGRYLLDASGRPVHIPCRQLPPDEAQIYRQATLEIDRSRRKYHVVKQQQDTELRNRRSKPVRKIERIWAWVGTRDRAVQYPIRGLLSAFGRMGFETRLLEVDPESYRPPWHNFIDLRSYNPDLVIQANLPSTLLFPPEFAESLPIPRIIWYLDNPRNFWHQRPGYSFTEHDYVFVWDESYKEFLQSCGAKGVHVLPLATEPQSPVDPQQRFRCTLSFVGQVIDQRHIWNRLAPEQIGALDKMVQLYMQRPSAGIRSLAGGLSSRENALVQQITSQLGLSLPYFLYGEGNTRRRVAILEAVAQYGLKLYGPDAWLKVTRDDSPLRGCFCGLIDYQNEFPVLSRSSTINLNVRSLQSLRSLNMRDYDVPLQGGFLLSEWVDGADSSFEPDKEMAFWQGIDDLKKKIEWYLDRPEEREQIIQRGRDRILRDHTYDARAKQVMEILSESL